MEDAAKSAGKGKWGSAEELATHVRDIKWTIDNPRQFVDANKNKEIDGKPNMVYAIGFRLKFQLYFLFESE